LQVVGVAYGVLSYRDCDCAYEGGVRLLRLEVVQGLVKEQQQHEVNVSVEKEIVVSVSETLTSLKIVNVTGFRQWYELGQKLEVHPSVPVGLEASLEQAEGRKQWVGLEV
jgi:hypothetical protein